MGGQNKALISYRVPREGGDPDPFTPAVSVVRKRKQGPHPTLSHRERANRF